MDFAPYWPALEAAGFEVHEADILFACVKDGKYARFWKAAGEWGDESESTFRSAVLKWAPQSAAIPKLDGGVKVHLWNFDGDMGLAGGTAPDYPTAWLEALRALHEAGMVGG